MEISLYEEAMFGRATNENTRPPRPNVIDQAIEAFGGKGLYRHSWKGHEFWRNGRWNGPHNMHEFIRQANLVLKSEGKPQIAANPSWVITEAEVCI